MKYFPNENTWAGHWNHHWRWFCCCLLLQFLYCCVAIDIELPSSAMVFFVAFVAITTITTCMFCMRENAGIHWVLALAVPCSLVFAVFNFLFRFQGNSALNGKFNCINLNSTFACYIVSLYIAYACNFVGIKDMAFSFAPVHHRKNKLPEKLHLSLTLAFLVKVYKHSNTRSKESDGKKMFISFTFFSVLLYLRPLCLSVFSCSFHIVQLLFYFLSPPLP